MKIGYLVPGVGLSQAERARRQRLLSRVAGQGVSVRLLEVEEGPAAIETAEDERAAVEPTVKLAKANELQFDAFVVGCFGDVGIGRLRREVRVPVIGPARATYSIAAAAFPTFSILSLNSGFIEEEKEITTKLGISSQVGTIRALDVPVDTIIEHPETVLSRIKDLVSEMEDLAVVPGCMSMAFLLEERSLTEVGGTRIVNPLRCAIRAAVAMVA